jgi:hypothetical protein
MKKIMGIVTLLLLVLTGTQTSADFYVIAGPAGVGTKITSLPCTISTSGIYYLAKNLTYESSTGSAITVDISDVTLDLMGFSLIGPGKQSGTNGGIRVTANQSNVEIRNGSVISFGSSGIFSFASCTGIRVVGIRVRNTGAGGMVLGGSNHLVMDCSVMSAGVHGIGFLNSSLIKGNLLLQNAGDGIFAQGTSTVAGNVTIGNTGRGIYTYGSSTVTGNTAAANTGTGIATLDDCTITNNTTDGLTYGSNCTDVNNTVTN